MEQRRWINQSQPQALQIAVILLYIDAALWVLRGAFFAGIGLLLIAANVAGGFGIANERRWGYGLGLAAACFWPVVRLIFGGVDALLFGPGVIGLMFEIALIALLLHPQSREYQRIWFK
jgi:hypothetical protein